MAAAGETLYEVLGVAPAADAKEIRAAYLRLAVEFHPDRHPKNPLAPLAEAKLAAVIGAYEVLSDPDRRAAYDQELSARGAAWAAPRVRREARALVVLLRALSVAVALIFLVRAVPLLWRLVRQIAVGAGGALGWLAGTPAAAVTFLVVVAGVIALALRWRRPRGRAGAPRDAGRPARSCADDDEG